MHKLIDRLLDLPYPSMCVLCRCEIRPGRPDICPKCAEILPSTPPGSRKKGDFFSDAVSPLFYEGAVKEAIKRYKFQGAQAYDKAFGAILASCIYEELDGRYDILSWVPLASDRRRKRGYDQAFLLAREVGRNLLKEPVCVLKKRRGVAAQSKSGSPEQRRANIAGAYSITDPALITGKRVLLIDDIITTGSTLSECAKMLLTAGAEEVLCATLARTR